MDRLIQLQIGHLDIIERAAKIFDILYVTVAIHPTK